MRRTLNYTDRQIIPEEDIRISLTQRNGKQVFDADLSFENVSVPEGAEVFVEAYYRTDFMRFNWGKIGDLTPPDSLTLDNFPGSGAVFFRVKVVDASDDYGRIIARREEIRPWTGDEDEKKGKRSLFPVRYNPELGDEVWRVSLDPQPTLEVNTKGKEVDVETVIRQDGGFAALVFHEALRRVLLQMLVIEETPLDQIRQTEGWESDWLQFAEEIYRDPPPDPEESEPEDRILWIDGVVSRFCSQIGAYDSFIERFSE